MLGNRKNKDGQGKFVDDVHKTNAALDAAALVHFRNFAILTSFLIDFHRPESISNFLLDA